MLENICQYFPAMIIVATLLGAVSGWFFKKITNYLNTKDLQAALAEKTEKLDAALEDNNRLEAEEHKLRNDIADLMGELDETKVSVVAFQGSINNQQAEIADKEQNIILLNDKIKHYELEYSKFEELSEINRNLVSNIDSLNDKIIELKAEILKKDALIVQKTEHIEEINEVQNKLSIENKEAIFQRNALKAKITSLSIELEELKKKDIVNTALSIMNKELSTEVENLTSQIKTLKATTPILNQENTVVDIGQILDLKQEITQLKIEIQQKDAILMATGTLPVEVRGYRSRILELESNEEKLGNELSLLRSELKEITAWIKKKKNKNGKSGSSKSSKNGVKVGTEEIILEQIRLNAYKIPFSKIGLRLDGQKDNLAKIKSISKEIERRLNAVGINSYLQLARMQDAEMIIIAEVIQVELQLIISGNWKGEARTILAKIAGNGSKDDLEKIEGIGPKIEELYFNNGIYTFKDLAKTDTSVLKYILNEGGRRFNRHNPKTWAKQAELAAEGKWEELKNWQDELDRGQ